MQGEWVEGVAGGDDDVASAEVGGQLDHGRRHLRPGKKSGTQRSQHDGGPSPSAATCVAAGATRGGVMCRELRQRCGGLRQVDVEQGTGLVEYLVKFLGAVCADALALSQSCSASAETEQRPVGRGGHDDIAVCQLVAQLQQTGELVSYKAAQPVVATVE